MNTEFVAIKKFSHQTFSISNFGRLQDITRHTKKIFSCGRLKVKDSAWSLWIAQLTAWCLTTKYAPIEICLSGLLISVFYTEMKFLVHSLALLVSADSSKTMHIFSVLLNLYLKKLWAALIFWTTFTRSLALLSNFSFPPDPKNVSEPMISGTLLKLLLRTH